MTTVGTARRSNAQQSEAAAQHSAVRQCASLWIRKAGRPVLSVIRCSVSIEFRRACACACTITRASRFNGAQSYSAVSRAPKRVPSTQGSVRNRTHVIGTKAHSGVLTCEAPVASRVRDMATICSFSACVHRQCNKTMGANDAKR